MSEPVLRIRLSAGYGKTTVLDGVALDLHAGDCLGLAGSSGAGKSTLVLALLGLLPWRRGWVRGEVLLGGRNLLALSEREARRVRGKEIALIPQSPLSALNPALSLRTQFKEAWRAHERTSDGFADRVRALMIEVQLPSDEAFLSRRPGEISVGQAQRVVLALALLHRPAVLIADEPTSALDPATQGEVLDLLRSTRQTEGTTLLYISHDLTSVLQLCDRVAVLEGGSIVECLSADTIEETARHPSTLSLLNTLPVPARVLRAYGLRETSSPVTAG